MDTEILEDLGLTQAEVKAYLALLELGNSTAGHILEKSKLHNSVMHRALNSLIEKGLINYVMEGRRKIYQATDPNNFHNYIDEKKRRFDEVLPELERRQQFSQEKEHATIYKGVRGINEIYNRIISTDGKEYNTFGGGIECTERMGKSWWLNIHRKRTEKNLPARQVFDETVREIGQDINELQISEVRFLAKEFAQFQETVIVGDSVAINIFTESPYGLLIQDAKVADGYRKHFEILWQAAAPKS